MPEVPQNISREHVLQAIAEVGATGIPARAQSSSYDLVYGGNRYPPKLLISIANRFANGNELSRQAFRGGLNTEAFNLLQRLGFQIEPKNDAFENAYQELRRRFLRVFPEFQGFDKDPRYFEAERTYKDEFVGLFQRLVRPAVERQDWPSVGKGLLEVLMKPLASNDMKPQNIVGWRYFDPIRRSSGDSRSAFGRSVGELLDESAPLKNRVKTFVQVLRDITGENGPSFPAMSRSLTSFILALGDPETHVLLKTTEIRDAMRLFDASFSWDREGLNAVELETIETLAQRLHERLSTEGWRPKDLIDVQSFLWVAIKSPEEASPPPSENVSPLQTEIPKMARPPLNQVLYGPPGTGKTYHTVNKALEILDPRYLGQNVRDRGALRRRFDEFRAEGRIAMVTFHQSFSYEDFVEGLRASVNEDGQLRYYVQDGIFKEICSAARAKVALEVSESIDPAGRRIWKMSLGNTLGDDAHVFDECIESGKVLLGYGRALDYSGAATREAVRKLHEQAGPGTKDFSVNAVHRFVNEMKRGDLVVISDGNHKFRAIGEITGDYRHLDREDNYVQSRDVRWLRVYSPSLPREQLMEKVFSQMTLYELSASSINLEKLAALLRVGSGRRTEKDSWVLIIDELNRGNIANIFGELITLIEDTKRLGAPEETTVTLPYSKTEFGVPENLHVICTMNTADRSLVHLDTALRRRFVFEALFPDPGVLARSGVTDVAGIDVAAMLRAMNTRIELLYDREHTLGHSYFLPLADALTLECLAGIFERTILPLLEEYFFEDWSKILQVLGDNQKNDPSTRFIIPAYSETEAAEALGVDVGEQQPSRGFARNEAAFRNPDAYRLIYERDEA